MRVGCAFALVGCALALAGCGTSPRQQVEAKVQQFAHATASKDYAALCDDVLAPGAGGAPQGRGVELPAGDEDLRLERAEPDDPHLARERQRLDRVRGGGR